MNPTRRNFRLGVINGLIYIFSETLLDPTLVLVAFLSQLTASPVLLGLVVPLRDGGWALPQLWVSGFLQNFPRKIVLYQRLSVVRILSWAFVAIAINFIRNPGLLLVVFFIAYTISSLASGLSGLPFLEVVGKTVAPERRGEFFAWRFGLGGLFSIGASFFVRLLIDPSGPVAFPHNYGILATIYFVLASISLLLYNSVDEPEDQALPARASFRHQFHRGLTFLHQDRNFRRFITLQSTLTISAMATPFFAVYVQRELGGSKSMIGVYLGVLAVTNLLGNILFGRISRRYGNRSVMVFTSLAGLGMSTSVLALALLARPLNISPSAASALLLPVFLLTGLRNTGVGVSANSLLLDIAPLKERSLYLGFSNTFQGLVLLSTGLSGVILGLIGFRLLVTITLVAHLLALFSARSMFSIQPVPAINPVPEIPIESVK